MSKELSDRGNATYKIYITLGVLYVLTKIAFVFAGYLHTGAILHGLIPAIFTVVVGFSALNSLQKSNAAIWHKLMIIFPALILLLTPIYMYFKEKGDWLINGRLEVLIIYEIIALIQLFIALRAFRRIGK